MSLATKRVQLYISTVNILVQSDSESKSESSEHLKHPDLYASPLT